MITMLRMLTKKVDGTTAESSAAAAVVPLPWKTRLSVWIASLVTDSVRRSEGTINRRLLNFLDIRTSVSVSPRNGVRSADIVVDPDRDLWFRLFVPIAGDQFAPADRRRLPVVVFFHGGGFVYLSPASASYDTLCRDIARHTTAIVVSVSYRLSPEHRFPAAYDDGIDVLRFLDGGALSVADPEASDLADLSDLFIVGDSAGGNISHHVARRWSARSIASSSAAVRLRGLVLIQPFFGAEERSPSEIRLEGAPIVSTGRTDWLWKAFLPEGADRDHEAAHVFGPKDTVEFEEGFPPAMVVVGGFDPLQDLQCRYFEGLLERGKEATLVEFPDAIHAFYVFPELNLAADLLGKIKFFVEAHRRYKTTKLRSD